MTPDEAALTIQLAWRSKQNPTKVSHARRYIHLLLEGQITSWDGTITKVIILATIAISILAVGFETLPDLWDFIHPRFWWSVELFCTVIFTLEYGLRLWSCTCSMAIASRWVFVWRPINFLDLCALVPMYVDELLRLVVTEAANSKPFRILRVFRLIRIVRVFKFARHSRGLRIMSSALGKSRPALTLLLLFLCAGVITFSTLIYYAEKMGCVPLENIPVEHRAAISAHRKARTCENRPIVGWSRYGLCCDQYESSLDYASIVDGFWWCAVTMTTVGYGDVYPRTGQGKLVAVFVMLSGILIVALPVAIVGRKFREVYDESQKSKRVEVMQRKSGNPCKKVLPQSARLISAHVVNARIKRKLKLIGKIRDLVRVKHKDREADRRVKHVCGLMSDYQEILEDDFRVHEAFSRRSEELLMKIGGVVQRMGKIKT